MIIRLIACLFMLGAIATGTTAWSQDEPPPESADPAPQQEDDAPELDEVPQQDSVPDVSEEQIEAFVQAYVRLSEVREEYTARVQAAEDQEEARQLQQEANEAMTTAIEETGLSVEEYQQVALAINADAELRDRVTEMLSEEGAL